MFLKPTSSYLTNGGTIEVPHPYESLDHEVELAVVISRKARDVTEATAMDYVGGIIRFQPTIWYKNCTSSLFVFPTASVGLLVIHVVYYT